MVWRKRYLLLPFLLFSFTYKATAQTPDTTTLKVRNGRLPNVVIQTKDGRKEQGYMVYHFPYSPDKEVKLFPLTGNTKEGVTYEVKYLESLEYPDLRYVQIFPDNDRQEYFAREAATGALNLYTFTELNKAPAVIPVAGVVRAISIPYDQSLFFIEKDSEIKKINRGNYQKELLAYVGSNAALAEKIKNKTYKYKDIETIIKEYNASVLKP